MELRWVLLWLREASFNPMDKDWVTTATVTHPVEIALVHANRHSDIANIPPAAVFLNV